MTNVSFYKLAGNRQMMFSLVCSLVKKAFNQGKHVLCLVPDDATLETIHAKLWDFERNSFIPHEVGTEYIPIGISKASVPGAHDQILINLHPTVPSFFSQFDRVIEIIYQDLNYEQAKRQNFRFYKDRGYPLKFHDLSESFTI
jgi:DNA polymerase-3 subunit chi